MYLEQQELPVAKQLKRILFLWKPRRSIGCDLNGANLYAALLSNADLSGADLSGTNLRIANLRDANLSGCCNFSGR